MLMSAQFIWRDLGHSSARRVYANWYGLAFLQFDWLIASPYNPVRTGWDFPKQAKLNCKDYEIILFRI